MNEPVKHTPGPWEVFAPYPDGEQFGVRTTDNPTSLHRSAARAMGQSDAERLANARLIAAAPELLAALETLVALVPAFRAGAIGANGSAARAEQYARVAAEDAARAAIAKAKGTA